MDTIGLDLHKRESQVCIGAADGTITEQRIVTSRERFTAVLGARPHARILVEASTESEWVARHLESLGHEVIVADPNYAPMYATRSRRTKTDKRDARTVREACGTGADRPAHRLSEARRHVRAELVVRDALGRTRTRSIALAKALVRRDGLRVPTSASAWVPTRIAELDLSPALASELAPLFAVFASRNEQIAVADRRIATVAASDPLVARLVTAPGVGPVTASAFVTTVDDITRFRSAHELEAYLGVVPSERSSGEKPELGRITNAGNGRMRWLLVEAAWHILRSKSPDTAALRAWTRPIAHRRGTRIAVVALARRLAGVLSAMWRDGVAYDAQRIRPLAQAVSQRVGYAGPTVRESS
jgi:transposase